MPRCSTDRSVNELSGIKSLFRIYAAMMLLNLPLVALEKRIGRLVIFRRQTLLIKSSGFITSYVFLIFHNQAAYLSQYNDKCVSKNIVFITTKLTYFSISYQLTSSCFLCLVYFTLHNKLLLRNGQGDSYL